MNLNKFEFSWGIWTPPDPPPPLDLYMQCMILQQTCIKIPIILILVFVNFYPIWKYIPIYIPLTLNRLGPCNYPVFCKPYFNMEIDPSVDLRLPGDLSYELMAYRTISYKPKLLHLIDLYFKSII